MNERNYFERNEFFFYGNKGKNEFIFEKTPFNTNRMRNWTDSFLKEMLTTLINNNNNIYIYITKKFKLRLNI